MWLHAFHVFVGIYSGRYPAEAPSLMKYGESIQDSAARGHNWRFYDETQATSLLWGTIHWELWLRSQNSPNNRKSQLPASAGKSGPSLSVPRGYCFKFHRGGECHGCSFSILAVSAKAGTGLFTVLFVPSVRPQAIHPRVLPSVETPTLLPLPGSPNPQLPTPVRLKNLLLFLPGYTNSVVDFLAAGFTAGFPLHYEGSRYSCQAP